MADKGYSAQSIVWEIFDDIAFDLNRKTISHFEDIFISHVFICSATQKHAFRKEKGNIVFDHFHIKGSALKTVY